MRKMLVALAVAMLSACSAGPQQQPHSDAVAEKCLGDLPEAARGATTSALSVSQAYASALPEILELTLTGAIRTGSILFRGIDDRPAFSRVPKDLRRQMRPLERAFDTIRRATMTHIRTLDSLRDAAEACGEAAEEADERCLESASAQVARSAEATIRAARHRLAIKGELQDVPDKVESASRRVERESIDLSSSMLALERCPN